MSNAFKAMEQADLFDSAEGLASPPNASKNDFLSSHKITLRLDHLLGLTILFLCVSAVIFSLGVEKGKGYAVDELKAERAKYQRTVDELGAKLFTKPAPEKALPKKEIISIKSPEKKAAESRKIAEKAAARTPEGNFTIQIVTYKTEKAAHRLISKLTDQGHKSFLIPSGSYLQVCMESFDTRQTANRALRKLKADGVVPPDAYVRPLPR